MVPNPDQTPVPGSLKFPNYLIRDPPYPPLPFCIKEYESCAKYEKSYLLTCYDQLEIPWNVLFGG